MLALAIIIVLTKDNYAGLLIVFGFLSCNAVFTHVVGAIKTRSYSPGMVTGVLIYIPLTVMSYIVLYETGKETIGMIIACLIISPL